MRLISKLFHKTLTGKIIELSSDLVRYIKDYNIISDTLYSEQFKKVLKRYLNINFKKDWIGRLYGVMNPHIDIDGKLNFNNTIIEIDDNNTNDSEYVKTWIYKQMDLIGSLFKINKLYDYISCDIERIDHYDNFLIIFDITSRKDVASSFKKTLAHTLIYGLIAIFVIFVIL